MVDLAWAGLVMLALVFVVVLSSVEDWLVEMEALEGE